MRVFYFSIILFLCSFTGFTQAQAPASLYNKSLADSLGADEYGMKWYVMVMLKSGSKQIKDRDSLSWLYKGHIETINELSKTGFLIITGPMGKNDKNFRSFYILNTNKTDEAQKAILNNPAVKYGLFDAEYFFWYGPAALPTYKRFQQMVQLKEP